MDSQSRKGRKVYSIAAIYRYRKHITRLVEHAINGSFDRLKVHILVRITQSACEDWLRMFNLEKQISLGCCNPSKVGRPLFVSALLVFWMKA